MGLVFCFRRDFPMESATLRDASSMELLMLSKDLKACAVSCWQDIRTEQVYWWNIQ